MRIPVRRVLSGVLAGGVVVLALALAAPAGATITISQSGGEGGTTTLTGDGAGDAVRIGYLAQGEVDCTVPWGCDEFKAEFGYGFTVLAPGSGCTTRAYVDWGILCPDSGRFQGDLGAGNDGIRFYDSLAYVQAQFHMGAGDDSYEGTPTATADWPGDDVVYGEDGADWLRGDVGDDVLSSGPCTTCSAYTTDKLEAGAGNDHLIGGPGNDRYLWGGPGNDVLDGGPGDDTLGWTPLSTGGDPGSDTLIGGEGTDTVTYSPFSSVGAVSVSLDGQANDGPAGENDNVAGDVEEIDGTSNADTLIGNDAAQTLNGGGGNDRIEGRGGNDTLVGSGNDDTLLPGPGADNVFGDATFCNLGLGDCPGGNDTIDTRDGERDAVECGPLDDRVDADSIDSVLTTGMMACEVLTLTGPAPGQPTTPSTPGQGAKDVTGPVVRLLDSTLTLRKGRVAVRVSCPGETARCSGTITLTTTKKVKLGSATFTAAAGHSATVRVKLGAKAQRLVRRARRLKVRVTVRDTAGNTTIKTATLTLRRK